MTQIYFVRHAEPDRTNPDDRNRPLTPRGMADTRLVLDTLKDKPLDAVLCSPYRRSLETVRSTAAYFGLPILTDERLRERRTGIPEGSLAKNPEHWKAPVWDPDWGESPAQVLDRYLPWLTDTLRDYEGKTVAVGTHGTAMSFLLHALQPERYGYAFFVKSLRWTPYILRMEFEGQHVIDSEMAAWLER